jgi:hypothetical protein
LRNLSYETRDTKENGIRYWIDLKTGGPIKTFQKSEPHDKQWLNDHKLGLSKSRLEKLKSDSAGKLIFVGGTSPIDHSESGLFDTIIWIDVIY